MDTIFGTKKEAVTLPAGNFSNNSPVQTMQKTTESGEKKKYF
jgi:hypothetical protein